MSTNDAKKKSHPFRLKPLIQKSAFLRERLTLRNMFSFLILRLSFLLTDVLVPSLVELAVVGEAALHGVETVVVTRLGSHEALTVRAVHHLR